MFRSMNRGASLLAMALWFALTTVCFAHPGHSHRPKSSKPTESVGGNGEATGHLPPSDESPERQSWPVLLPPTQAADTEDESTVPMLAAFHLPLLLAQRDQANSRGGGNTPEIAKAFDAFVKAKAIRSWS